jgi:hypothetical protein
LWRGKMEYQVSCASGAFWDDRVWGVWAHSGSFFCHSFCGYFSVALFLLVLLSLLKEMVPRPMDWLK